MQLQNRKFVTAVIAGPAIALLAAAMVASGVAQANGDSGSLPRFYGVVNSRPSGTNVGNWVLGNRTFVAGASTEFVFLSGPLNVGVCAKAKYETINGVDQAVEIESENPSDCGISSGTPGSTPSASPSVSPSTSPSVSPSPSSSPSPSPTSTSTPIPGFTNRAYGILSAMPAGRIGNWVAGGVTYQVTSSTELEEEGGPFVIGGCVKSRYAVSSGVNVALEIETESASDCNGLSGGDDDDDDDEYASSNRAKVYAPIDSFPASPFTGTWTLAGVAYQASASTRFEQDKGAFANGACVEARYVVSSGANTLTEVETTESYKCQGVVGSNPNPVLHSYGTVESFPNGLLGVWRVSNITYTTTSSTTYEQSHGTFAVGTYVEVKYQMVNGARLATKIETHVAPQAGLGRGSGRLDNRPSDDWGQWTISGVTYQGDRAIEVEIHSSGALNTAGAAATTARIVAVNYYELDGVRYATSVRELIRQTYLPVTLK